MLTGAGCCEVTDHKMKPKRRAKVPKPIMWSQDVLDLERRRSYDAGLAEGKKAMVRLAEHEEHRARLETLRALGQITEALAHALQYVAPRERP